MMKLLVYLPDTFRVTQEQFEQLIGVNQNVSLECTVDGVLIIMSPDVSKLFNRYPLH